MGDFFGSSVSISGNNVLIGAWGDDTGAEGAGAAYLFDATTGKLTQTFLNPTPDLNSPDVDPYPGFFKDAFASSMSISGNNVLIGAYLDDTQASDAGAAYLFDAITGDLLQTFFNPTPEEYDQFGYSVSISGNNVLIGAPLGNTGALYAGAAYLFDAITGDLLQTFLNPTPGGNDAFGYSVSINGNNVLIGGVSEAVYLYQPVPEPLTILGAGTAMAFGAIYKRKLAKKR